MATEVMGTLHITGSDYDPIEITVSEDVTKGTFVQDGDRWVVAYDAANSGDNVTAYKRCPRMYLKKKAGTGMSFTKQKKVHLDTTAKAVTPDPAAGANPLIGTTNEAVGESDTWVLCDFNSNLAL